MTRENCITTSARLIIERDYTRSVESVLPFIEWLLNRTGSLFDLEYRMPRETARGRA
jgi:hypothetical protein